MPSQVHMHLDVLFNAGVLLMRTLGEPGAQGAGVTGMQGIGVRTPSAAVVAVATAGFASEAQSPKGWILARGMWSLMVAALGPVAKVGGPLGIAIKALGAAPKLHISLAPVQTCVAMGIVSLNLFNKA